MTRNEEILALLDTRLSQQQAANRLGVTKNVVAGIWARAGRGAMRHPRTLFTRMDELDRNLNAVLAANPSGLGRISLPAVTQA